MTQPGHGADQTMADRRFGHPAGEWRAQCITVAQIAHNICPAELTPRLTPLPFHSGQPTLVAAEQAMSKDFMNYNGLVQDALRGVVRQALVRVARQGLPGAHHLYIAFRTHDAGVDIPDFLRERYPEEMTIVLQHQFWGLEVREADFEVQLSFNKSPQRLVIPFAALAGFFDPSVQFGLQFQQVSANEAAAGEASSAPTSLPVQPKAAESRPAEATSGEASDTAETPPKTGEVVTLDAFRRK